MLRKEQKEYIEKAKKNPKMINYLYGEITDRKKVIELLGIDKDSVVLDVGVGKGTFLTYLIMLADCKGIGVEPVKDRYEKAVELRSFYKLDDRLELHNKHYPCEMDLKPTHVILHACAFRRKNILDVYNALPRGVKILHNSLHLQKYAHKGQNNKVQIRTSYIRKGGTHFWIHEK